MPTRNLSVLILLFFAVGNNSPAVEMHPTGPPEWNRFVILLGGNMPLLHLGLDFEGAPEGYTPAGVIEGIQAPGETFWLQSWSPSPPDRVDHFSIVWSGTWRPGNLAGEIRLRADEQATLSLDGSPLLVCTDCPAGVTAAISLDQKPHDLRLEYLEREGPAYIFLEWREPERDWKPVPVTNKAGGEEVEGWEGKYSLGERFASEEFVRIDPMIAFNWGESGPFERLEDLPTLRFRWGIHEGALMGEISANREGRVRLLPEAPSRGRRDLRVQGSATSMEIRDASGTTHLELFFDRPGNWIETEPSPRGVLFAETETQRVPHIPITPAEPIRFWEKGSTVQSGPSVSTQLDSAQKVFDDSRITLSEGLAEFDADLVPSGRYWNRLLLDALKSAPAERPGKLSVTRKWMIDAVAAKLPEAASRMTRGIAPDLREEWEALGQTLNLDTVGAAFVSSSTEDLAELKNVLESLGKGDVHPPRVPTGLGGSGPPPQHVTDAARGWIRALSAFARLEQLYSFDSSGNPVLGNPEWGLGKWKVDSIPLSGSLVDLTLSRNLTLLAEQGGPFIQLNRPARFSSMARDPKLGWSLSVEAGSVGPLEVGPSSQVQGVEWDGTPLLMVQRGGRLRAGKVPSERGALRLLPGGQAPKVPIR
ncbi:MAG: hypothetical protein GHCLOJNM_02809 [bacterium]|nr:hypothetical protein [bacterium]